VAKDNQWITVQEAARRLGVKEDAIRKRMQRGTLKHEKDPTDGRVYVYLDTTQDGSQDTSQDTAEDASYDALVETLSDQVSYLKAVIQTRDRELEARTEELRRKDHIIAALTERIPELEPASETRKAPERAGETSDTAEPRSTTEEQQEPTSQAQASPQEEQRSWWRRMFGG
jgi:excisionase family DNA binding protein